MLGGVPAFCPLPWVVEVGPDALAGEVRLVSALGQHHPPIELCAGAAVLGIDVLPDNNNPNLPLGQVRLSGHSLVEVSAERVLPDGNGGVTGLDALQELLPARSLQSGPGLVVAGNETPVGTVLGQLAGLRLQVLLLAV